MRSMRPSHSVTGLVIAALVGTLGFWSTVGAAEFYIVVQDGSEQWTLWISYEEVIHYSTEMQDGLVFMLENPTDRTSSPPTRSPLMSSI